VERANPFGARVDLDAGAATPTAAHPDAAPRSSASPSFAPGPDEVSVEPPMDAGTAAPTADAARGPCDTATAGPSMVPITTSSGATYCIDSTEVTVRDYAAFLATDPASSLAPAPVCAWKRSFVPDGVWPPADADEHPVSSVDWCDAAAYCSYAGKHLCGQVGGGPTAFADATKPVDEWYYACTSGGKTTLPYGDVFDPTTCVGADYDGKTGFQPLTDTLLDVGAAKECHSAQPPFDALRDLAGNVAEWQDSCGSNGGSADYCHIRGASFREGNSATMACDAAPHLTRSMRAPYVGFRCCL
jgi:formylglycine-generating enzyme required for sulfatase activity